MGEQGESESQAIQQTPQEKLDSIRTEIEETDEFSLDEARNFGIAFTEATQRAIEADEEKPVMIEKLGEQLGEFVIEAREQGDYGGILSHLRQEAEISYERNLDKGTPEYNAHENFKKMVIVIRQEQ